MPIYSFAEGNGDHHNQPMNERERERERDNGHKEIDWKIDLMGSMDSSSFHARTLHI